MVLLPVWLPGISLSNCEPRATASPMRERGFLSWPYSLGILGYIELSISPGAGDANRTVFRFNPAVAPVKATVFPLLQVNENSIFRVEGVPRTASAQFATWFIIAMRLKHHLLARMILPLVNHSQCLGRSGLAYDLDSGARIRPMAGLRLPPHCVLCAAHCVHADEMRRMRRESRRRSKAPHLKKSRPASPSHKRRGGVCRNTAMKQPHADASRAGHGELPALQRNLFRNSTSKDTHINTTMFLLESDRLLVWSACAEGGAQSAGKGHCGQAAGSRPVRHAGHHRWGRVTACSHLSPGLQWHPKSVSKSF